jgi:hypothetical protein
MPWRSAYIFGAGLRVKYGQWRPRKAHLDSRGRIEKSGVELGSILENLFGEVAPENLVVDIEAEKENA